MRHFRIRHLSRSPGFLAIAMVRRIVLESEATQSTLCKNSIQRNTETVFTSE